MAVQTLLARQNRTGTVTSNPVTVPASATGRIQIMSNLGAADLADATNWVDLHLERADAAEPGGWRYVSGVLFQCGPVTHKDGTVNAAGEQRGFVQGVDEVAGQSIRGVLALTNGDPRAGGTPTNMQIGITYELLP